MPRWNLRSACAAAVMVVLVWAVPSARAIDIVFDYTYDTGGFFDGNQAARDRLEEAAAYLEPFTDNLQAIVPGEPNTWSIVFTNPGDGDIEWVSNPTIPADVLVVYVGGRDMPGSGIGLGGPGGWSGSGTSAWLDTLTARGQDGALAEPKTDFAPWGGSVTFDSGAAWHFGETTDGLAGKNDFLSTACHELVHVLGFGTSDSWQNQVGAGHVFLGSACVAEYGGSAPLHTDDSHWAEGTISGGQEVAMDPTLTVGTRKLLTPLDMAALADIGWEAPPETMPGDLDDSGFVGGLDLNIVLNAWGQNVTPGDRLAGDPSGDGLVAGEDLNIVLTHWGDGEPPAGPVPEPATVLLLVGGASLVVVRQPGFAKATPRLRGSRR